MTWLLAFATLSFSPVRIDYTALSSTSKFKAEGKGLLSAALASAGMVQVTNIPHYSKGRVAVLESAARCASWSTTHKFDVDATTRRTIASKTIPGPGGAQPFKTAATAECESFAEASTTFRQGVDEAVRLFGHRVATLLDVDAPLLETSSGFAFDTFGDVVDSGDHLEHIHAYSKASAASSSAHADDGATLPMHTDQGLFIAFTPALVLGADGLPTADGKDASRFVVKLSSGETVDASFDPEALVFMIGQGVEQVVRPRLRAKDARHNHDPAEALLPRATPHALQVLASPSAATRMWYGRMVLPPSDAIVAEGETVSVSAAVWRNATALEKQQHGGLTYGALRDAMNRELLATPSSASSAASSSSSTMAPAIAIGCSGHGDTSLHELHRRVLAEPASCTEGTELACWHRCMPLADGDGLGTDALDCASQGKKTRCVNTRDQIAPGNKHGDYFPSCTNTEQPETPLPTLAGSEKRPARPACDAAFASTLDAIAVENGYTGAANLSAMCGAVAWGPNKAPGFPCLQGKFLYKVVGGVAHGTMVVNGSFGWLAIGLEKKGGAHNGMNGGKIVMATPGSPHTYSPRTGLDLATGPSVHEYIINEVGGSAFRFWSKPFAKPSLSHASFERGECFTAMSFASTHIAGERVETAGTSSLIWAFNDVDSFVGYHGREKRGKITVEWGRWAGHTLDTRWVGLWPLVGMTIGIGLVGIALGGLGMHYYSSKKNRKDDSVATTATKVIASTDDTSTSSATTDSSNSFKANAFPVDEAAIAVDKADKAAGAPEKV